ncbi:MAG TPA: HEAT repeat domain-containing protein [Myxococcales bacterium]|jgi:hypothetical protein
MAFTDYRQVSALPLEEVRALLAGGEPVERVWAIWSLALTSASTVAAELKTVVGAEPSAGVRRHAATVLAGLGERDTLASLARLDPDSSVRSSACRLLARISPVDDERAWDLLVQALGDARQRDVQMAVMDGLTEKSPQRAWEGCLLALRSDVLELRCAALEAAIRRGFARGRFTPEMLELLLGERDPGLRNRLLTHWIDVEGADAVAAGLAKAPSRIVLHFLEIAKGRKPEPTWPALFPLAQRHDPEIDERLAALARAPLDWMMEVVTRSLVPEAEEETATRKLQRAALHCVSRLEEELPLAGAEALGYEGLTVAKALHDVVVRALGDANAEAEHRRVEPDEETDSDFWGDDQEMIVGESLLPDLKRLIVCLDQ